MSTEYKCNQCNRTFMNEKGLIIHERAHREKDKSKLLDEKYLTKRIANTRSVQLHRQLNPKVKFEELEEDTKQAIKEAKLIEKFLRDELGLLVPSYEDKIKKFQESNGIVDEEMEED